jgi:23S rRNA (cytidine1920-2'-O)/16S rRNA (cytidine1409-2'-O)-methyltransferase
VATRHQAADAIAAGRVTVSGAPATKSARLVAPEEPVLVAGDSARFVTRGGHKLDAALSRFPVGVAGRRALDAGAAHGGFTDCLLQRGAASVVAFDVGLGQLDMALRQDQRVEVREGVNVRHLDRADVKPPVDLVVADLSFISLSLVAVPLLAVATDDVDVVLLVKPQFEVGRVAASRGKGVIRDPDLWREALERVDAAWRAAGAAMMDVMASPLRGARGNVEFLAHLRRGAPAHATASILAAIREGGGPT